MIHLLVHVCDVIRHFDMSVEVTSSSHAKAKLGIAASHVGDHINAVPRATKMTPYCDETI